MAPNRVTLVNVRSGIRGKGRFAEMGQLAKSGYFMPKTRKLSAPLANFGAQLMRCAPALALGIPLAACSTIAPSPQVVSTDSSNWHSVVTSDDRIRLRDWRQTFLSAVADAQKAGHSDDITRQGALLNPDAAVASGAIPNGLYRCRTIKLGAKSPGMLAYVAYPPFTCQIRQQGKLQMFAKLTGSQRQVGTIFPSDGLRQVFLGSLVLGDETRAQHYGTDDQRNVAGYIERIGSSRWRMVMPSPSFESKLDVMELVPAT